MRGGEGVVHKHIAQGRHLAGQRLVVFFFPYLKAHVFAQHDFAGGAVHALQPVGDEPYRLAEQGAEGFGDRGKRGGLVEHAFFRPAKMREHDHAGTGLDRCLQRR